MSPIAQRLDELRQWLASHLEVATDYTAGQVIEIHLATIDDAKKVLVPSEIAAMTAAHPLPTPRTDAALNVYDCNADEDVVSADFARTLERENAELRSVAAEAMKWTLLSVTGIAAEHQGVADYIKQVEGQLAQKTEHLRQQGDAYKELLSKSSPSATAAPRQVGWMVDGTFNGEEHVLNFFNLDEKDWADEFCATNGGVVGPLFDGPSLPVEEGAIAELENIANAKRFDRKVFDDDTAFADWAQSRARHTLSRMKGGE